MSNSANQATRDRFGQTLVDIAAKDRNVVALDCDLGRSTRAFRITEVDPGRFVEMGIAEQDMISTAAGMASVGKTVFVNSFAVFITGRCFDQIRQQVALPKLNVKICGSSSGLTQGPDGATHQSVVDVALMRSLPNMTVIVPADGNQTEEAIWAAYRSSGPFYIRLSRLLAGDYLPHEAAHQISKATIIRKGADAVLVSCGPISKNVILAADRLSEQGFSIGVAIYPTVKPFDHVTLAEIAAMSERVLTVEEHSVYGGLGSAVAESIAETILPARRVRLLRIGVNDKFGESGTAEELLRKHRLDPEGIADTVTGVLVNDKHK